MADLLGGNIGSFVPTSYVWDVARLYEIDVNSDEFKELLVRLYQNLNLIANTGTLSVPHGISVSSATSSTLVIGSATNPTTKSMIPLPYASPILANNIELNADATNVNITTGSDRSGYTVTYVILEYLQS
jgi:hypothetical protein